MQKWVGFLFTYIMYSLSIPLMVVEYYVFMTAVLTRLGVTKRDCGTFYSAKLPSVLPSASIWKQAIIAADKLKCKIEGEEVAFWKFSPSSGINFRISGNGGSNCWPWKNLLYQSGTLKKRLQGLFLIWFYWSVCFIHLRIQPWQTSGLLTPHSFPAQYVYNLII